MKIWQLDPANLTPYYDKALCSALANTGHDLHFFTTKYLYDEVLTYPDTFKVDFHYFQQLEFSFLLKFPIIRRGLRLLSYPLDHWRLLQKCRQDRPDVIHLQWSRVPIFDLWFIKQVQKMGIPVIHTVHDVVPLFSQGKMAGNLGDIFSQVDALVVHTADSQRQMLEQYPQISANHIHIIPHLEEGVFIPPNANRKQARNHLKIAPATPMILFFGNVKYYKGVDLLPEIFHRTKAIYPDLQLWIVGKPDTEDDKIIVDKLKMIEGVNVRDTFIPYEELWMCHLATDISIYPYRNIFQSGALLAGLSFGCAVVVTDVGGLPDGVDGNGWIVPPENPQAFADALIEALSDKSRLHKMGQRSRQIIDERFGAKPIAQQHINLYQSLIETSKQSL